VPIVLATIPWVRGAPEAQRNFHLVFFVVLVSVLLQGGGLGWVARRLGVTGEASDPAQVVERELTVARSSRLAGRRIFEMDLPASALVVGVERAGEYLTPRGQTEFRGGDRVRVWVAERERAALEEMFG
jgi:cell volume regulation protein A